MFFQDQHCWTKKWLTVGTFVWYLLDFLIFLPVDSKSLELVWMTLWSWYEIGMSLVVERICTDLMDSSGETLVTTFPALIMVGVMWLWNFGKKKNFSFPFFSFDLVECQNWSTKYRPIANIHASTLNFLGELLKEKKVSIKRKARLERKDMK